MDKPPVERVVVAVAGIAQRGKVQAWVGKLAAKYPGSIILTTGETGAGFEAERAACRLGLRAASLRAESRIQHVDRARPRAVRVADWDDPSEAELADIERKRREEVEYSRRVREAYSTYVVVAYELWPEGEMTVKPLEGVYEDLAEARVARDDAVALHADQLIVFGEPKFDGLLEAFARAGKDGRVRRMA